MKSNANHQSETRKIHLQVDSYSAVEVQLCISLAKLQRKRGVQGEGEKKSCVGGIAMMGGET